MSFERTLPKSCLGCPVYLRTEWCVLGRTGLAQLARRRKPLDFQPGQIIFQQKSLSQGIYCIESGHILLRQVDTFGNETAFRVLTGGETVGWRSLFGEQPHAATAQALTACRLCLITRDDFEDLAASYPDLVRRFLKTVATDRGPAEALLLRSPLLPVHIRLIHLLILLRDRCATSVSPQALVLELPLKRKQIASMIGARTETLSRAIRQLGDMELAQFEGRRVMIPDYTRLLEMVRQVCTESGI